jgi:hypothetical protein
MFRRLDFKRLGPSKFLFKRETAAISLPTLVIGEAAARAVLARERSAPFKFGRRRRWQREPGRDEQMADKRKQRDRLARSKTQFRPPVQHGRFHGPPD